MSRSFRRPFVVPPKQSLTFSYPFHYLLPATILTRRSGLVIYEKDLHLISYFECTHLYILSTQNRTQFGIHMSSSVTMIVTIENGRNRASNRMSINRLSGAPAHFSAFEPASLYEVVAEEEKSRHREEPLPDNFPGLELKDLGLPQAPQPGDPMDRLPTNEREILIRQVHHPTADMRYLQLYRYASRKEIIICCIPALSAIIAGILVPMMTVSSYIFRLVEWTVTILRWFLVSLRQPFKMSSCIPSPM